MLNIIGDLVNHLQGEPNVTKVSVSNEKSGFAASHFEETFLQLFLRVTETLNSTELSGGERETFDMTESALFTDCTALY